MVETPAISIAQSLDRSALLRPDRPCITYLRHTMSALDAALTSRRLAQLLLQTGVSQGDRVMIVARNSPYHLLLLAACSRIGAILVPVSAALTRFEAQRLVDFCAPRAIVCSPETAALGPFVASGSLSHFVIDDDGAAGPLAPALEHGYLSLTAALAQHDGDFLCDGEEVPGLGTRAYPTGPVLMQFVAGEASTPKAVCLTCSNLFWAARNLRDELSYGPDDVTLVVSPMSNGAGLGGAIAFAFASGGHIVIMRSFEAPNAVKLIEDYRVSVLFAVPTVYRAMLSEIEANGGDLSSVRLPMIGGAEVPPELLADVASLGLAPLNVWGTTHMGGPGIYMPADLAAGRAGSIGHPLPYISTRVVNPDTGEDVPDGEVGELLVAGPSVVSEFWHGSEYTEAGFLGSWLRTGDLVQADGPFLTMEGHRGDRIVTGGVSVYPSEIEAVLADYPGLTDAAVASIPDDIWGEIIVAAIVLEEGAPIPELAHVQEFCVQKLAAFKLPRLLLVMPSLQRDERGEVNREALRKLATSPSIPEPEPFPVTATVARSSATAATAASAPTPLPPTATSPADL